MDKNSWCRKAATMVDEKGEMRRKLLEFEQFYFGNPKVTEKGLLHPRAVNASEYIGALEIVGRHTHPLEP